MKIERAKDYLKELSEHLEIDECKFCECLQGAIIHLRIDFPGLKEEVNRVLTPQVHRSLGCVPCPPAEVWVKYLTERESTRVNDARAIK